ncbi:hypothetical protein PoB_002715800 [Plakobranchus ocellatus]|uniref:Uncharacterized protein n=1 Tax=Plakobranchus ocellatus TaxID=259542 RepID=A0AAV4A0I9_9GAST|nr:hypothetical protein PoB_002715800 [Plakobranchus ocellatus]
MSLRRWLLNTSDTPERFAGSPTRRAPRITRGESGRGRRRRRSSSDSSSSSNSGSSDVAQNKTAFRVTDIPQTHMRGVWAKTFISPLGQGYNFSITLYESKQQKAIPIRPVLQTYHKHTCEEYGRRLSYHR